MRRIRPRVLLVVVTAAAPIACHEVTAPAPCDGSISVSIGFGSQPTFAWSPACGISELVVSTVPANATEVERQIWGFSVSEQAPIGPRVDYGKSPRNATIWTGPEAITAGKTYRVTVRYTVGGDVVSASGSGTFTWFPPD